MTTQLENAPLGKKTSYVSQYQPSLLFPVSRAAQRKLIGITEDLPFSGVDIWNAYELSWLNQQGKPQIAIAEFVYACDSEYLIESKSFKLYLNSFNQTKFKNLDEVKAALEKDLSAATHATVTVSLITYNQFHFTEFSEFQGDCIDDLNISTDVYQPTPDFLTTEEPHINETLYSYLLKSNCPMTDQPDWGSVLIQYEGRKINQEGLLKYIISMREHREFHEQCVERMYKDILERCEPEKLTVYARYTRRGGLDINPFRSNFAKTPQNLRQCRQ